MGRIQAWDTKKKIQSSLTKVLNETAADKKRGLVLVKVLNKIVADNSFSPSPELPDLTDKMVSLVCDIEYHNTAYEKLKNQEDKWRPVYQKAMFFHKRGKEKALFNFEKSFPEVDPEEVYNEYSTKFDEWVNSIISMGSNPTHLLKVKDLL